MSRGMRLIYFLFYDSRHVHSLRRTGIRQTWRASFRHRRSANLLALIESRYILNFMHVTYRLFMGHED